MMFSRGIEMEHLAKMGYYYPVFIFNFEQVFTFIVMFGIIFLEFLLWTLSYFWSVVLTYCRKR